jgi:hypothetical protein
MDYEMYRGDTLEVPFQAMSKDETPVPVDITGAKVWFTVKYNYGDPDSLAVSAFDSVVDPLNVVITTALQGIGKAILPAIATRAFPDGDVTCIYDIQMKTAAGAISTIKSGTILVHPDVTRAIS